MAALEPWNPSEWDAELGNHLGSVFRSLDYAEKVASMTAAYNSSPSENLAKMKEATGNTVLTEDINYIWSSSGRMSLMLEKFLGNPDESPHKLAKYDSLLRAWVIDLEDMYNELMKILAESIEAESSEVKKSELEADIEKFDKKNTCDDANWANGISLAPTPKFFVVSQWIKKYFPDEVKLANKIYFYKKPGTTKPPFLQIKVHRMCFFFKGTDGVGTVLVNPELAKPGENVLRGDIPAEVYNSQQFTVEIIDIGKAGKLTILDDRLYVLPMAPKQTKKFNPHADDFETDAQNSYLAFKKSHPDTVFDPEAEYKKAAEEKAKSAA